MVLFDKLKRKTSQKTIIVVDSNIFNELDYNLNKSWKNRAIKEYNIEVRLYKLNKELMNELIIAKERQGKDFKNK